MKYLDDNPVTRLLLAASLALSLVIAAELAGSGVRQVAAADADAGAGPARLDATPQPRYVHPDFSEFAEILARPIFFASRELPAPPQPVAAAPRTPLRLKLEGVAITASRRVAVLRDLGNNTMVQLSVGMTHGGWQLEELDSTTATFRRDTDRTVLSLDVEK